MGSRIVPMIEAWLWPLFMHEIDSSIVCGSAYLCLVVSSWHRSAVFGPSDGWLDSSRIQWSSVPSKHTKTVTVTS